MKCKLNDLCFVIKTLGNPLNLGKVVTCKEYLGYFKPGLHHYKCNLNILALTEGHHWIVEGSVATIEGRHFGYISISESELLPIPTEPIEDSEISSKELEFN